MLQLGEICNARTDPPAPIRLLIGSGLNRCAGTKQSQISSNNTEFFKYTRLNLRILLLVSVPYNNT